MEEVFKPVEGFEDLYQISNLGRLLSLERVHEKLGRTIGEKLLKYRTNNKGYICVDLFDSKTQSNKKRLVHRLMAIAFIPNDDPLNKTAVNHKNGIRTHNIINVDDIYGDSTNLEWISQDDNTADRNTRQKEFKAKRIAERGMKLNEELVKDDSKYTLESLLESLNEEYTLKDLFK